MVSVRNAGLRARMLALRLFQEEASHVRSQARRPSRSPPGARKSPSPTANCAYPISRSYLSSKATARDPISGARACACSTPPCRRRMAAKRKIRWMEVFAGEKANKAYNSWLPDETVTACRDYLVSIKGPLTTPVGGGIRSLNVALRQLLDLYVCLRPVRWFKGVPSPVVAPEKVDMVIFRENTEDIYAGIEFEAGSADVKKFLDSFKQSLPEAVRENPLSRKLGHRPEARLQGGDRAAVPRGRPVRHRQQAQERDDRAQGQHHEVHRGRVPQLVLPARRARIRRSTSSPGSNGSASRRARGEKEANAADGRREAGRARSSSRTPSPTSRCSRCSLVPTSSTWSPP